MALNKTHTSVAEADRAAPAPAPAPAAKKAPAAVEAAPAADMELGATAEFKLGAMGKFRARSVRIRDPHAGVMFYTDRDCPAEITPWLKSQLNAGIIFTC